MNINALNVNVASFATKHAKNGTLQAATAPELNRNQPDKADKTEAAKSALSAKIAQMKGKSVAADPIIPPRPGTIPVTLGSDAATKAKVDVFGTQLPGSPPVIPLEVGPNFPNIKSASIGPATEIGPLSKAQQEALYETVERMQYLANQSANQMSPEGRERAAKEFEQLSQKLNKMIEKYELVPESVVSYAQKYIDGFDISSQEGGAEAYYQLYAVNKYFDNMYGIEDNPIATTDHGATLQELQAMARRAGGPMSEAQREELNKQFDAKISEYMEQLEASGLIDNENIIGNNDTLLDIWGNYMSSHDLSTPENAQMAFNNLMNQESYVNSLEPPVA